jgi:hypothetical protein
VNVRVFYRELQQIAAYCSFWEGFARRLVTRGAIDNGFLSGLTEPMSPQTSLFPLRLPLESRLQPVLSDRRL